MGPVTTQSSVVDRVILRMDTERRRVFAACSPWSSEQQKAKRDGGLSRGEAAT